MAKIFDSQVAGDNFGILRNDPITFLFAAPFEFQFRINYVK